MPALYDPHFIGIVFAVFMLFDVLQLCLPLAR